MRVVLLLSLALLATVDVYATEVSATAPKHALATGTQAGAQSTEAPPAQAHDTGAHQSLMAFLQAQAHSQAARASQARAAAARAAQARTGASTETRNLAGSAGSGGTAAAARNGMSGSAGTMVTHNGTPASSGLTAARAGTSTTSALHTGTNSPLHAALVPSAPTTRALHASTGALGGVPSAATISRTASINGTNIKARPPF
jgi:hypothetical protein